MIAKMNKVLDRTEMLHAGGNVPEPIVVAGALALPTVKDNAPVANAVLLGRVAEAQVVHAMVIPASKNKFWCG